MAETPDREHTPKTILVTGGAGFIGCNLIRYLLANDSSLRIVNIDALTYAGSLENLRDVEQDYPQRYKFIHADICDTQAVKNIFAEEPIDTVIHLAAESHVDRSITGPEQFLQTNIMGTFVLLQRARAAWADRTDVRFHHVSTDEVFGSLDEGGYFTESTPYDPSGPYSASKAASDHLVRAWHRTYALPVTVSNCSNNYGPYQFPEKFIPLLLFRALKQQSLPIYGDGLNVRDWLFVEDHCRAIDRIVRYGQTGRTYNIGGQNEWTNIDVARLICDLLQEYRPLTGQSYHHLITFVTDRCGHDRRYAMDITKLRNQLGWTPQCNFQQGLRRTIQWFLSNTEWVERIRRTKYDGQRLGEI